MNMLTNLSIQKKLILAFSLVLMFTAGLGGFSITRVQRLAASSAAISQNVISANPLTFMLQDADRIRFLALQTHVLSDPDQAASLIWPHYSKTLQIGATPP
jgi:hypothetical protein